MCLLSGQLVVCTLCSCVMQTKRIWLFSAHLLPLVARLCLVPLETIVFINKFSMIFTGLEVIYFLASNLLVPYNLAKTAYRELAQVFIVGWCCKLFSFCDRISVLRYFSVDGIKGILYFGLFCPAGGRSVRASCFGNVTVEPAGPSSSLHVFLARAVCSADILLLQHKRPAYFQREAAFPFSYKVRL